MKKVILLALVLSNSLIAAEIKDARLDDAKENIEVTVSYGGGCKEHEFSLDIQACLESYPVQCTAQLVHNVINGPDFCEAYITKVVTFNLEKLGFKDDYYSNATLSIIGDKNYTGEYSSATIKIP